MTTSTIKIRERTIGHDRPVYIVAEVSANHGGNLSRAEAILLAAAGAGADAVKFQTYRPETMTLAVDRPEFTVPPGSPWTGRTLYDLYSEGQTPWEWMPQLFALGKEVGVHVFSSPFDKTAVEYLEQFDPPAYKVASFELVDLELIAVMARTGRPLVISTGMATVEEIDEAVLTARGAGATNIALLRCNSTYPAPTEEMDLRTIPDMLERWSVPVGLSDHTMGTSAAVVAVALGARLLERHITLSRTTLTTDAHFSLEPDEFGLLVRAVREAERALGSVRYGASPSEAASLAFRRSLYVVSDVAVGQVLDRTNVDVVRPANGLAPRELPRVLGRRVCRDVTRGTPLSWEMLMSDGGEDAH